MNGSAGKRLRISLAAPGLPPPSLAPHRLLPASGSLAGALGADQPDLLLLAASALSPADAALLMAPPWADLPLILLVGPDDAEAAGLLIDRPLTLLDWPAEPAALSGAVEALAGGRLHAADAGSGYSAEEKLAALRRDAERVAEALAELSGRVSPGEGRPVTAARIRAHIRGRRQRERFFAAELFADPVWDILLDLAAARLEGRAVSVSSLCIAAAVPTTTALRTIRTLSDRGMLTRRADPADARRSFIGLSPQTARAMEACLDAVLNQPGL